MLVLLPNFKPAIENNINFKYYALSCNTHIQKKKCRNTDFEFGMLFKRQTICQSASFSQNSEYCFRKNQIQRHTHTHIIHTYMYKFSSEVNG